MSAPIRDTRAPNFHEAIPFLDQSDADTDLELQSLQARHGPRRPNPFRPRPTDTLNESHEEYDYNDKPDLSTPLGVFKRWILSLRRAYAGIGGAVTRKSLYKKTTLYDQEPRKIRPLRTVWRICVALLMILGLIQLATLILGLATAFFPEKLDHAYRTWRNQEVLGAQSHWPTDYTADITPVACHSHNDYWRRVPLKSAIKAGCTGVEADVWLIADDLYVGHAESALTANRTFTSLYINPLVEILDRQNPVTEFQPVLKSPRNGVFDTDTSQTLVLLVDFKTDYQKLWPVVETQLKPLRQKKYLTYFNGSAVIQGPITVVVTGNAPFDLVVQDMTYRDMFFDAPLEQLASLADVQPSLTYDPSIELAYKASMSEDFDELPPAEKNQGQGYSGHPPQDPAIYTLANSFYASVDFKASIGWPRPYLSQAQRDKIESQIAGAHAHGLKVRYWGVPNWPIGLRNYLWRELVKMGVDYLNVDDLQAATRGDWRSGHSIWDWSFWGGRDW